MMSLVCLWSVPADHTAGKVELILTQMRSCGVTAPCVVVFPRDTLEGCGLIDWDTAGPVLVFKVGVLHRSAEGRELVWLPRSHR